MRCVHPLTGPVTGGSVDVVDALWVADAGLDPIAAVSTAVVQTLHARAALRLVGVARGGLVLALQVYMIHDVSTK